MEYQRELRCSHYYEYYNLEGGTEDGAQDEDAVEFSRGRGVRHRRHFARTAIDVSSHTDDA